MKYHSYNYIYPPRPSNAIPPSAIKDWDNGVMIAQPKLNGSNCILFTNGIELFVMNRHHQRMSNFRIDKSEIMSLYKPGFTGWLVLNGEWLNKSKTDDKGEVFNHKLVIFDILVYNSEYLIGKTFQERVNLLDELYGTNDSEKSYLFSITNSIYRVKSYSDDFVNLFANITKRGTLIEGIVMKRKSARLELGNTATNNSRSQIKCRVPTKNYKF